MDDTLPPDTHTDTVEPRLVAPAAAHHDADSDTTAVAAPVGDAHAPGDADVPTDAPTDDVPRTLALASGTRSYSNKKTPDEQALAFIALVQSGVRPREAAIQTGINIRTCYGVLARMDDDVEATRAATLKLLQMEALDRLDDWRAASDVGARKKGNHTPARDWLLHAGILDPLASEGAGSVRIAINIGTDERPMRIASPLSVDVDDH